MILGTGAGLNYLAHILLADDSPEARIGGLLGDFVKGDPDGAFPPVMAREIRLHRQIDAFTDAHPAFLALREHFPSERRRFAGIVLDVCFDHALARSWARWCTQDLPDFTRRFYGELEAHRALLPDRLLKILPALVEHDWLASYRDFENVAYALERMAVRRLKRGDGLAACVADARAATPAILDGFEVLWPDVQAFAQRARATSAGSPLPR